MTDLTESRPITSDIHLEEQDQNQHAKVGNKSRIEFRIPLESNHSEILTDQDGDLITERHDVHYLVSIEHETQTNLQDVGLQLWRSSFYLSDYLLNNLDLLKNKVVVELGAGLGLVSFIGSFYSKLFFCTDLERVVKRAEMNWNSNQENLKDLIEDKGCRICFKKLDWSDFYFNFDDLSVEESKYKLNEEDFKALKTATLFLAADVIYDHEITLNFFNTIFKLMTKGVKDTKLCLIANEKRINFDLDSLSINDVAFNLFEKCIDDLDEYEDVETGYVFEARKIKTNDLEQFILNYKRTKYLEIWMVKCTPKSF